MSRGGERSFRDLVPKAIALEEGTVSALDDDDAHGRLLTVVLQPSGREVSAVPLYAGWSDDGGVLVPFRVGQVVMVLMPDGDPNRAYAVGGTPSSAAPVPDGWDHDRIRIEHVGGVEVRLDPDDAVEPVLLDPLQGRLAEVLNEIKGALATIAAAVPTSTPTTPLLDALVTDLNAGDFAATALSSS